MSRTKTSVQHWKYRDGWNNVPQVFRNKNPSLPEKEYDEESKGWSCWVYPASDLEFETWMEENLPTVEFTHRFNSGDPMYTVFIKDDEDAIVFKLKWI